MEDVKPIKAKGRGVLIFIIFLLILIVSALVGYILIDKEIVKIPGLEISSKNDKKDNQEENVKEVKEALNVDNPNVVRLFNLSKNNYGTFGYDELVYGSEKISVDDMDEIYKMQLASNIFSNDIEPYFGTNATSIVSYESVKNAYETIFGPNTFNNTLNNFTLLCDTYNYDALTKSYNITSVGCGGTTSVIRGESVVNAYKYSDRIEITTAVAYYNVDDSKIFRDLEMKNEIKDFKMSANIREELNKYVADNKDYLTQFTFTYELGEDGFYYFVGVEKTQE